MWVEDYEYVDTDKLVIRRPRNVIVVFMESFEKMYGKIKDGEKELSVDVDGALMYDGFVGGAEI